MMRHTRPIRSAMAKAHLRFLATPMPFLVADFIPLEEGIIARVYWDHQKSCYRKVG
jgi:hypothetical protein